MFNFSYGIKVIGLVVVEVNNNWCIVGVVYKLMIFGKENVLVEYIDFFNF